MATIWQLIEERAEATPDALMFIDDDDSTLTFGGFRDRAERVAAGLPDSASAQGTPVTWQLPTRIETVVLSMALARFGAVQYPVLHLYREKELGFVASPHGGRVLRRRRRVEWVRLRRHGRAAGRRHRPAARGPRRIDDAPRGRPGRRCRPLPPTPRRRAGPVDLLHLGDHLGPQGRAATPTGR